MSKCDNEWHNDVVKLANTGVMSWRDIAKQVGVSKSTVSDYLRKYYKELGIKEDSKSETKGKSHLVIFDTQVRPGIDIDYLRWIGEYIVHKKPDVIVMIGDHADMPSLSSYDKGKKSGEGRRIREDIDAAQEGMYELLQPMYRIQAEQFENGEEVYSPRMVLTLGNHESRIERYVEENPEQYGFFSIKDLEYEAFGWEVYPFLTPVDIDGISYCHYFPNVMTGKPLTGNAQNMLKVIGKSFTMGHRQLLDVAHRQLQVNGERQWGLINGASYIHDEHYKGEQGNKHWRGIVLKHNVKDGGYDPLFVSMDWLEKKYGGTKNVQLAEK